MTPSEVLTMTMTATNNDKPCFHCVPFIRPAGGYLDDFAEEARASKDATAGCSRVGTADPSDAQEWARWILTGCSRVGTVGLSQMLKSGHDS